MSLKLIKNPELFQGNFDKKNYFEGWYFKHVSADGKHTIAFIPGISLDGVDSHSFVQVIVSPDIKTYYFRYPLNAFSTKDNPFSVTIGDSVFSMQGCKIALDDASQEVSQGFSFTERFVIQTSHLFKHHHLRPILWAFLRIFPTWNAIMGSLA